MQPDRVVFLAAGIRDASATFDRAMAVGRHQEAQAAGNCIWELAGQLRETIPTTPRGAAVHLRLAIDFMDWADSDEIGRIRNRLTAIERRLLHGWRRAGDVAYLRSIAAEHDSTKIADISPDATGHIRIALAGLQNRQSIFCGLDS